MNELDALKQSVLEEAEIKGQEYYKKETAAAEKEFNQKSEILKKKQTEAKESQLKKMKQSHEANLQQFANRGRQMALISKQEMMDQLFEQSLIKLEMWSVQEEMDFILKILSKYDHMPLSITFGEKTYSKLSQEQFDMIDQQFPGMSISDNQIPREAGFILSNAKVDYNYLYSKLIKYIQTNHGMDLVNNIIASEADE